MITVRWRRGTVLSCCVFLLATSLSSVGHFSAADDEAKGDAEAEKADRLEMRKQAAQNFDWTVLSSMSADRTEVLEQARDRVEAIGKARLRLIDRWCHLNKVQERKLNLAARGEVSRLFERISATRAKYIQEERQELIWGGAAANTEMQTLKFELQFGPFRRKSIFHKTLLATLNQDQLVKYHENDRLERLTRHRVRIANAITLLEFIAPLKEEQRKQLSALIEGKTPAPEYESGMATYVVLYRVSEFPDKDLTAILTPAQWKAWESKLRQYQQLKPHLESERLLTVEPAEEGLAEQQKPVK